MQNPEFFSPSLLLDRSELAAALNISTTQNNSKSRPEKIGATETTPPPPKIGLSRYIDRFIGDPRYADAATRSEVLREDMRHLLLEVNLAQTITEFSYQLDVEEVVNSSGGYLEDLGVMTKQFVDALANSDKSIQRGVAEYIVFERVKQFFARRAVEIADPNIPTSTSPILVITSPPDSQKNGYHGSDNLRTKKWNGPESHHSFCFVLEISDLEWAATNSAPTADNTPIPQLKSLKISVTQFRTWHNLDQWLEVHQQLGQPLDRRQLNQDNITSSLFTNAMAFEVAPDQRQQFLNQLTSTLYSHAESWPQSPQHAPQFADHQQIVDDCLNLFDDFYLPQALALFTSLDKSVFNNPQQYEQAEAELELLQDYYLRAVEKYISQQNINPLYQSNLRSNQPWLNWIKNKLSRLKTSGETLPTNNAPLQAAELTAAFQLHRKTQIYNQKLSTSEKQFLKASLPALLEMGNFAFGGAQCLTLAPFTAPISMMKMASMGGMGGVGGGIGSGLANFEASLSGLDHGQKENLYQELINLDYQPIKFQINGQLVTYMVPAEYVGDCYEKNGVVYGPCDIDLDQDPYAFAMEPEEFAQYLESLRQSVAASEQAELHQLADQIFTNPDQRDDAHQQIDKRARFKPVVSFIEVINNDVLIRRQALVNQLRSATPHQFLNALAN